MDLKLAPKPIVTIRQPANKGIVSRKEYFVKKIPEEISEQPHPVQLIRNWKPKASLLYPSIPEESLIRYECDVNRKVQNIFIEDDAEEIYVSTPPTCFVVVGKRCLKLEKLVDDISERYGVIKIEADKVLHEMLLRDNEISKFLDRVLRTGAALTLNFILALMSLKAHTHLTRHRGYVISGLPSIPYSFDKSAELQLNYIFMWDLKPTVFVHVSSEDDDLIIDRIASRFTFNGTGREMSIDPEIQEEDSINREVTKRGLWLTQHTEPHVWAELERFYALVTPVIDIFTVRMDPQYRIKVDTRCSNIFEMVQAKLSLLPLQVPPSVTPFIPIKEPKPPVEFKGEAEEEGGEEAEEEEEDEMKQIIGMIPEEAFLFLFDKRTISPKFRWELSHYNYICPVALRYGEIVEGLSEFAVVFMKYIYFISSKENMLQFIENPRPFVLPVRPLPLLRFIITGYPYSGKTKLARGLAAEYGISYLDVNKILLRDQKLKKKMYREFCRERAMQREVVRLTAEAWRQWREEEEERVACLEEWIAYMQSILTERMSQFYSSDFYRDASEEELSDEMKVRSVLLGQLSQIERSGEGGSGDGMSRERIIKEHASAEKVLQVRGIGILGVTVLGSDSTLYDGEYTPSDTQTTPSTRIIHAMRHENYEFNPDSFEIEAELFFAALWKHIVKAVEMLQGKMEEEIKKFEPEDSSSVIPETTSESTISSGNWGRLLPPQSLSSLHIWRKTVHFRERRRSFSAFLAAASKHSWKPTPLRSEFSKWSLPCFMDIPLCEKYNDNPLLLLKYSPEELKERPPIPEPIDCSHPLVVKAGHKAFKRAGCVEITHNAEEMSLLLNHAIMKAERNGRRTSGEIITSGGWVIDSMPLDLDVWKGILKENHFPDHIYILWNSEEDNRRMLQTWNMLNEPSIKSTSNEECVGNIDILTTGSSVTVINQELSLLSQESIKEKESYEEVSQYNIFDLILRELENLMLGDKELDDIYAMLQTNGEEDYYCQCLSEKESVSVINICSLWPDRDTRVDIEKGDDSDMRWILNFRPPLFHSESLILGPQLIRLQSVIQALDESEAGLKRVTSRMLLRETCQSLIDFFISFLECKLNLNKITAWLDSIEKGHLVKRVDTRNKTNEEVEEEIIAELHIKFGKRPRHLEDFEVEELEAQFALDAAMGQGGGEGEEEEEGESPEEGEGYGGEKEDIRIYGESGPFCVVALERGILLKGKQEFVLRYWGKLYFFSSEQAVQEFIKTPEKYAPYYSTIRCLPPLRIYLIGSLGSGKSTIGRILADHLSLHFIDYIQFINTKCLPNMGKCCQKIEALKKKTYLGASHNQEVNTLLGKFNTLPYTIRSQWLEGPPFYPDTEDGQQTVMEEMAILDEEHEIVKQDFPPLKCVPVILADGTNAVEELEGPKPESSFVPPPYYPEETIEGTLRNYISKGTALSTYYTDKTIRRIWTEETFISKGFVMDDFPLRGADIEELKKNNWLPDVVLELNLGQEEGVDRVIDYWMKEWEKGQELEMIEEDKLEMTLMSIRDVYSSNRRKELLEARRNSLMVRLIEEAEQEKLRKQEEEARLKAEAEARMAEFAGEGGESYEEEFMEPSKSTQKESKISVVEFNLESNDSVLPRINSEQDALICQEVENVIDQEFPPMIFNVNWEQLDQAQARIEAELNSCYSRDIGEIDKVRSELEDSFPRYMEIDSHKSLQRVLTDLFIEFDPLKKRRDQRCEFAFTLKMDTAETLIKQGFYFVSKFGKWCPVQIYELRHPLHMYRPFYPRNMVTPIAYRNYIYYVGGEYAKEKFLTNPLKYTFNEPRHPIVPVRIAVIGPPKSGKTILAKRLGATFDFKVITMGDALRFVMEEMPNSRLASSIDHYLRRGCFLPLTLKIEAVEAALHDPRCVTQGYIFDGFPFSPAFSQSLAEKGILPFVILSLVGEPIFSKRNMASVDVQEFRLKYKNRINIDRRYDEWDISYPKFSQWNNDMYHNVNETQANANPADIFYWALNIISKAVFQIHRYVYYVMTDTALQLEYLCVSQDEFDLRKSQHCNCCPVCWATEMKLTASRDPPVHSGLVQYLRYFYWVCPDHMEDFLSNPKRYFPPYCPEFPTVLPVKLDGSLYRHSNDYLTVHGYGRCPVTRVDFPRATDIEGKWDYAVSYNDEIYLMRDPCTLDRFMSRPWKYFAADTIFEVDVKKNYALEEMGPTNLPFLPTVGYLEQTLGQLLQKALLVCGRLRPIYPNMEPYCTGSIFVGLYLKVWDKTNKTPHIEQKFLDVMMEMCNVWRFDPRRFHKPKRPEMGQGDFEYEPDGSYKSESEEEKDEREEKLEPAPGPSVTTVISTETQASTWIDMDMQADKKMWAAEYVDPTKTEMFLTEDDELVEIPEVPKYKVRLRLQTYTLRHCPIPPITCLNFFYTVRENLKLPEKFNFNRLYQPLPLFTSPFSPDIVFNPEKEFDMKLYTEAAPADFSEYHMYEGNTNVTSESTISTHDHHTSQPPKDLNIDPELAYMLERFIPRFQILDVLPPISVPTVPVVIEIEPIIFNPHRDYTYLLLFCEFFTTSFMVRGFRLAETFLEDFEFLNRVQRHVILKDAESDIIFYPTVSRSVTSTTSLSKYHLIFDEACSFFIREKYREPTITDIILSIIDDMIEDIVKNPTVISYTEMILFEIIDEICTEEEMFTCSESSFLDWAPSIFSEIKNELLIEKTKPYPPLIPDIICLPYYSYCVAPLMFIPPVLDPIAHERHVSTLDGIDAPTEVLKFVQYPPEGETFSIPRDSEVEQSSDQPPKPPVFLPYFEHFNIPWTAFLAYPFSWAYNLDLKANFDDAPPPTDHPVEPVVVDDITPECFDKCP